MASVSLASRRTGFTVASLSAYVVVPPDGGWGWTCVVVSFLANFVADGAITTYSIFKKDIQATIHCSDTKLILPNSVMTGVYFMAGPFICAMANKFGFRVVSITGGICAAIGYILASYTTSLAIFILCYGFIAGVGFSMLYIGAVLVVGFYFEKWRAIANAVSVCGSALGTTLFPIIFNRLFGGLTWQWKYSIIAGFCMFISILSITYKPIPPKRVQSEATKQIQDIHSLESASMFDEDVSVFVRYTNLGYPTVAEVHAKNPTLIGDPPSKLSIKSARSMRSRMSGKKVEGTPAQMLDIIVEDRTDLNWCHRWITYCKTKCCWCCINIDNVPQRPMYRDDILYQASLSRIVEYQQADKQTPEYTLQATRVTTLEDIEESHIPCIICTEAVKRTLATMLDWKLFRSPSYMLLNCSTLLTIMGFYIPFLYIAESAMVHGLTANDGTYLLSSVGISNAIGRILCGAIASIPKVKPIPISIIGTGLAGMSVCLIPVSYSLVAQYVCACAFGLCISVSSTLRSVIIVDIVGLGNLANAFGIFMLFQGMGSLTAISLVGYIKQWTGSYVAVYLFSGFCLIGSALVLVPLTVVMKKEKAKKMKSKRDRRK